jgi:F-type H+-transporting ATPase subunit a
MVTSGIGSTGVIYLPILYSLLFLIMGANLLGMIPYSLCVTAQFALCLSLSIAILIGVTLVGVGLHGLRYLSLFVPAGTPLPLVPLLVVIELTSYGARTLSLGIRLAANMIGGHVLLKILSTFTWKATTSGPLLLIISIAPILCIAAFTGLELAIACIQAYVFVMLTVSYLGDAVRLHDSPGRPEG